VAVYHAVHPNGAKAKRKIAALSAVGAGLDVPPAGEQSLVSGCGVEHISGMVAFYVTRIVTQRKELPQLIDYKGKLVREENRGDVISLLFDLQLIDHTLSPSLLNYPKEAFCHACDKEIRRLR
jgi:hypothetical protein